MTQLAIEHVDRVPVARLPIDVDTANAAAVGDELARAVNHDAPCLVVDLSATRYLDSSGIGMLFQLNDGLSQRRQQLRLVVGSQSPLARLIEIAALDVTVPVHASVEDAVAACTGSALRRT